MKTKPAKRVAELTDRRTADAKVFRLSDGRLQKELSAVPLHYRGSDHKWRDIDPTVKRADPGAAATKEGFVYQNRTNSFSSFFGSASAVGSGRLVRFSADGAQLTLGASHARHVKPEVKGDAVRYGGALSGADLDYQVGPDGLKEKIVLPRAPKQAGGEFEFTVRADGVRAWQRRDGSIAFYKGDFDGRPVFVLPKPFMYDSTPDKASPFGMAWSPKVTQSMRWDGKAGLLHVVVRADNAWLNAAQRRYPVTIDPTIKIAPTPTQSQDTMISSDAPDQNYDDSWRLSVGTTNSGASRALVKFPLDEIPAGTKIDSAQLQLYYDQNHTSNANPVTLEAHRATADWDETTATWNSMNTSFGALTGRTVQVDDGDTTTAGGSGSTSANGTWPYSTNDATSKNGINGDYAYNNDATTGDTYTWTPTLHESGTYRVDVHYVEASDRATAAPYTVVYDGGSKKYTVDQSDPSATDGVWKTLGTQQFVAGTAGRITLGDVANKAVVADAVRLVKFATVQRPAGDEGSHWHSFAVADTVQNWVNKSVPNYGFMVKAADEATLGQGGPRYEGSLFFYNGETATYPRLEVTYGRPGVEVDSPTTIHSTGAELSWPAYQDPSTSPDDDVVEYQVHRSVWQTFTPSAATLVAPLSKNTTSYTDTSAEPTPADSSDPFGNSYYYMVAVKTRDGQIIPGPTQLARLPKAGRVTKIYQSGVADTTLTKGQPDTNQDVLDGEPWLMAGNNSATYGTSRAALKFPELSGIPSTARVVDAQVRLWNAGTDPGAAGSYELRGLTRPFGETTATWNKADASTAWTTPGGDLAGTAAGTSSNWTNDPQQRVLDATSLAQQWVADPASNDGAVVKLTNESTPTERAIFVSSEGDEPQLRPQLTVSYLETTPENTYYVPRTPDEVTAGSTQPIDVTVTNTTTSTWNAADWVLSYRWSRPDGTPVSTTQSHTALPKNLVPGDTATVTAQVTTPPASDEGNKRVEHVLEWDMWNQTIGQWLSGYGTTAPNTSSTPHAANNTVGALKQSLAVEDSTSDQVGLEDFYAYGGADTGAGSALLNNLHAGNAVWQYNAFTNPSRGLATFVRLAYNSKDTSDTVAGYGWSVQAASLMRLGSPIDPHPNTKGRTVALTDGDGTTHTFTLDDKGTSDPADDEYIAPAGVHYYLQKMADCGPKDEISQAWLMTRPDRTQFAFDCQGYLSSIVDKNGNRMDFTYEVRKSNNKPVKFLRYITDPVGRQTLTVDYYAKGDDYPYIDDDTWQLTSGTGLTNPHIIDHVKQITDISGRKLTFTYTAKGLLGRLTDGTSSITDLLQSPTPDPKQKTFRFAYDATQGNKNVKLTTITDPRGHDTKLAYYDTPEDDPAFKWSLKTITDRRSDATGFAYTDPDGTAGQQVQTVVTDAKTHATTYLTDGRGRPLQSTNAENKTSKLGWDDDNNVTRLEEPPSNTGADPAVSTWTYDPKTGYPTEIKDARAVANGWDGTRLTYQTGLNGHIADLIAKQSPEGRTWGFGYTTEGDLASVTDPIGTTTDTDGDYTTGYTYDTWGQLQTVTDANKHTTTPSDYDANGQPETVTDPLDEATHYVYDDRGETTKVTDPLGHITAQAYDTYGRPLESTQPKDQDAGVLITTPAPVYDANDNVLTATAPNGAQTTATYDDADETTAVTAPKDTPTGPDRTTGYAYDKVGNVTAVTAPKGMLTTGDDTDYVTSYGYDDLDQLTDVTDAKQQKTSYVYDDVGNVVTVIDPRKNATASTDDYTTKYGYDLTHQVTDVTDALGHTQKTAHDRDGLTTATTDQNNTTTTIGLDARGAPITVTRPRTDSENTVTGYVYDQVGNRTKVITPRGEATATDGDFVQEAVYDELNRVKERLTPFDPADSQYTTANKTIYSYDDAGRLSKVSAPPSQGQTVRNDTTYSYYDNGWIHTSTDPWDIVTSYDYNDLGQQTNRTLTSAGGSSDRTMTWSYYPDGKLQARSDSGVPVGKHVVLADDSDIQNAGSTGGTWTSAGTGKGFQGYDYAIHTAGSGSTSFVWNLTIPEDGNYDVLVKTPDLDGAAPDAKYTITDSTGSTAKTVDQTSGGGTWKSLGTHTFAKTSTGGTIQQISVSDQATAGTTVLADAVKLVRDNTGDTDNEHADFTFGYDPDANLTDVGDTTPGADIDTYAITYGAIDQLQTVQEKTGGVSGTVKHTTGFTYNPNLEPTTRTHDDQTDTYSYDARDLVDQVTNAASANDPTPKVTKFTYTPRGQRETQVKGNGNTVTDGYYLDGLLKHQVENKPDNTVVAEHTLDYDPNGNKTHDTAQKMNADNNAASINTDTTWEYDPLDRIRKLTKTGDVSATETYTHDANDNVTAQTVKGVSTTYNYDRNRLLTSTSGGSTAAYNYDPYGRLDTITSAGHILERNTYDGFDRTTKHEQENSSGALTTTDYTYDPFDRTTSKTTDPGGTDAKTTIYNYLGLSEDILNEEVDGKTTKTYQYAPSGERLSQVKNNTDGTKDDGYYGYNDHTDVETLTGDNGNTKATYGYTAYGNQQDEETTGIDKPDPTDPTKEPYNPYRYSAKRWDPSSGTYDTGFRDYKPSLNQFLTRDTYNGALDDLDLSTDPFSNNRYAFTSGNPVSNVELDGHQYSYDTGHPGEPGPGEAGAQPVYAAQPTGKHDYSTYHAAAVAITVNKIYEEMKKRGIDGTISIENYTVPGANREGNGGSGKPDIILWGDDGNAWVWEVKSNSTRNFKLKNGRTTNNRELGPEQIARYVKKLQEHLDSTDGSGVWAVHRGFNLENQSNIPIGASKTMNLWSTSEPAEKGIRFYGTKKRKGPRPQEKFAPQERPVLDPGICPASISSLACIPYGRPLPGDQPERVPRPDVRAPGLRWPFPDIA